MSGRTFIDPFVSLCITIGVFVFFSFVLYLSSGSTVFVDLFALYFLLPSKKDMSGRTVADSFVLLCVTLGGEEASLPPIYQIAPHIIHSQS